jgi:integrase
MAKKYRGRNEGSLHQRPSGSWRAQILLNGKRISFGAKTKTECQVWLRKMQEQLDRGYDYEGSRTSLEEYLQEWLQTCKISLRPKTAAQYELIARKHIVPYLGQLSLKDIHPARVESLYSELILAGKGVRTVRLAHSVLHSALERAVRHGLLMRNPATGAALPHKNQTEMLVLDESQVTQFLVAAHQSQFEALYHLAVVTGMRQGELFGLKWGDLHWNSGTLDILRQVQGVRGQGWNFTEPKTRSGRRSILLGEGVLQALRLHRDRQQLQKATAGERWKELDLIFPSSVGTPMDASNLRLDFYKVLDHAGLPKIRFHDLRHTAASLMLNHNIPVIVVSKILGHSKPSITLDIYGHLYHEMQGEAARMMDGLVTPIRVELSESKQNAPR